MLAKEINAAGGILGRPLELVIYDTEGDESKAVQLTKKLIHNDKGCSHHRPDNFRPLDGDH